MGATHLECHLHNPNAKVLGVIDADRERGEKLAASKGVRFFASLSEAFAVQKADFVDVCTPSAFHKEKALEAMQLGADVLVEKPFAVSLDDIDEMISFGNRWGRRIMVAHVCRYMPQYQKAKALLDDGVLGNPLALFCERISDAPAWSWNNWFQNKQMSGGTLLDLSIHDIDIANWLLGTPMEEHAFIEEWEDKPGASHITSQIRYPNGSQATIIASHLMPVGYPLTVSFCLLGTKGSVEWNSANSPDKLLLATEGSRETIAVPACPNAYAVELSDFVGHLQKGTPFIIQPLEARLAVATVHKLYENADISSVK